MQFSAVIPVSTRRDSRFSFHLNVALPGQAIALIREPGAAKEEFVEKMNINKRISLAPLDPGSALRLSGERGGKQIRRECKNQPFCSMVRYGFTDRERKRDDEYREKKIAPEITNDEERRIEKGIEADPDTQVRGEHEFSRTRPATEMEPETVMAYKQGKIGRGPQK